MQLYIFVRPLPDRSACWQVIGKNDAQRSAYGSLQKVCSIAPTPADSLAVRVLADAKRTQIPAKAGKNSLTPGDRGMNGLEGPGTSKLIPRPSMLPTGLRVTAEI
jgi:hypothetical protein